MSKYKLIKEYPGSPSLNTEVDENYINNLHLFTEFWQEIIEKDYEILSFRNKICGDWFLQGNGEYRFSSTCSTSLESMLKSESNYIHSVKRLSDGEIFTIGDKTNGGTIKQIVLCGLEVCSEKRPDFIHIVYEHDLIGSKYPEFKDIQHTKKSLFITEDGVDVFEGDWYEYLHKHSWSISRAKANKDFYEQDKYSDNSLYFSTKEKAQEYIDLHKPKYSLMDIKQACQGTNCFEMIINSLKRLNK